MKRILTMVCAIILACAANAEDKVMEAFRDVRVNVPARVRVLKGDKYDVVINGSNDVLKNVLRCQVRNGVLTISSPDDVCQETDGTNLIITIISPEETRVKAGSNMEIRTMQVREQEASAEGELLASTF